MMDSKGGKTLMTLNSQECLIVAKEMMKSADGLYNDAVVLSNKGSYGSAISLLILSLEESMKAGVLYLDGNGFEFRNNVGGINKLFKNHTLRYPLAMILSCIHLLFNDLIEVFTRVIKNPELLFRIKSSEKLQKRIFEDYIDKKIDEFVEEAVWFRKAGYLRQEGFYVDYENKIKSPLNVSKEEYKSVKIRIDSLRDFSNHFFTSYDNNLDAFTDEIRKFQLMMKEQGWYQKIGELISKNRDSDLLDISIVQLKKFKERISDYPNIGGIRVEDVIQKEMNKDNTNERK